MMIILHTAELDSNKKSNFLIFAAIPSLRARDCSKNEKEALNYLFLLVPLLNVTIPFFWKSFAVVWSADTVAFFAMYAWKVCNQIYELGIPFNNCDIFSSNIEAYILFLQLGWLQRKS